MTETQEYEDLREAYNVSPVVGERVIHMITGEYGTIRPRDPRYMGYVAVKFDGWCSTIPCDPTRLEYGVRK